VTVTNSTNASLRANLRKDTVTLSSISGTTDRCGIVSYHPRRLDVRYNFVPLELQNNVLAIAAADPGQVQMSDELPLLLARNS